MPLPKNKAEEYLQQFTLMASMVMSLALFFVSPKLAFAKIKDLILALITACFTLYLMYNVSAQLSELATDMTEGVSLSGVTINPQTIFKAGMRKHLGGKEWVKLVLLARRSEEGAGRRCFR